jgi:endonuclease YncB( thermonuclease family)
MSAKARPVPDDCAASAFCIIGRLTSIVRTAAGESHRICDRLQIAEVALSQWRLADKLALMAVARRLLCQITAAIAISALIPVAAEAQVTGRATALGADILRVEGQAFRLSGVDAIEFHQSCFVDGRVWACGASAVRAFQTLVDGFEVTCTPAGDGGEIAAALCVSGGDDLAEIMARQGWALAHGVDAERYSAAEEAARAAGAGIWQGRFVNPWDFREDIAAIERAYAVRAAEMLAAQAEERLTVAADGAVPFRGFAISGTEGGAPNAAAAEIRLGPLPYGAVLGALDPEEVFDWTIAAVALWEWRQEVVGRTARITAAAIWDEFNALPGPTVASTDAEAYFAAMMDAAAPLLAAGRQPVLLVSSTRSPDWIADWLAGSPPGDATVLRKEGQNASYRGTIGGVDVHVGQVPLNTSLVFPDDILVAIAYGALADGSFVAIEVDPAVPEELVLRYARTVNWSGDPVIRISFPAVVEDDPFYREEVP